MIGIHLLSALTSALLFRRLFSDKYITFFGVLFYLTCPYRLSMCSGQASFSGALVWALLPLYVWAVSELFGKQKKSLAALTGAALILAVIGFADIIMFLILLTLTLLTALWLRRAVILIPCFGAMLCCPGRLFSLTTYLLSPIETETLPLHSIMSAGYLPGQFFSGYAYQEGQPGAGMGILLGLAVLLWLLLVEGSLKLPGICKTFLGLGAFLSVLSLRIFPWDLFQRLGLWALRLISLLNSPGIFFGLACFCLCIPAGYGMGNLCRHKEKTAALGIPLLAAALCLYTALYQ